MPKYDNIVRSTWSMKKKSNVECRSRLRNKSFDKFYGIQFDPNSASEPVVNIVAVIMGFFFIIM